MLSQPHLEDVVFVALKAHGPGMVRQITRRVHGPYWSPEEEENTQRALSALVEQGRATVSGVTYTYLHPEGWDQ
jgi:hypothetical protein